MNQRRTESKENGAKRETIRQESGKDVYRDMDKVEKLVRKLFSRFKSARIRTKRVIQSKLIYSQIDYKLAQRLDSAGHQNYAQKIVRLSEKKSGFSIVAAFAFLNKRTPLQWLGMGMGTMTLSLVMCGLAAFGLVYYRGTDIPILRNFAEQAQPMLSLTKESETEYGVVASGNSFTIDVRDDVYFRTLGLKNKVSVEPQIVFEVAVSQDNSFISVIPAQELAPDTTYTVTMRKGTMFSNGTSLSNDVAWSFRTEPEFAITGITPKDGSTSAPIDTTVEIEFTYKNLDVEKFQEYFAISPDVSGSFECVGKNIVFIPDENLVPLSQYRVTIKSGFSDGRGNVLSEEATSTFRVSSVDSTNVFVPHPTMMWSERSPIISMTQDPWLGMYTYGLTGNVDFTLYSASPEALLEVMKDYKWQISTKPSSGNIEQIRTFSLSTGDADFFTVELNDCGIYFLEAYNESYGRSIYVFLIYSPIGLVYSNANNNTQLWLSEMNEKKPVSGGTVAFYDFDYSESPIFTADTDTNGYAFMGESGGDFALAEYLGNYAVGGTFGNNSNWWYSDGYWDREDAEDIEHRAYVYTDRPFYRAGDTVHFKAIVREEDDMVYSLPSVQEVTIRMGDHSYLWSGLIELPDFEKTYTLSTDFGTLTDEFVVPSNMEPGYQQLGAFIGDIQIGTTTLMIAEYEKPRYRYSLSLDKTLAVNGDSLNIVVSGTDYTGDPAAGQKVGFAVGKYSVSSGSWIDDPEAFQAYSTGNNTSVIDETLVLDSDGRAEKIIDLDIGGYSSGLGLYRVTIWSKENYASHDSDTVLVASSNHFLFLKGEKTAVKEGESNKLLFRTARLWTMESEGGVRVEYRVSRSWTQWVEDGEYYDPLTKTHKPLYRSTTAYADVLADQEVTTDETGSAVVNIPSLEKGSYTVTARYYNDDSAYARTFESVFYVYEEPDSDDPMYSDWGSSWEKIKIYADKSEYVPGDTANIAIKTTLKGKGLYMIKRGDVYAWRVADFSSGLVEIQQEITSQMAPYVYICAWGIDEYMSSAGVEIGDSVEYLSNVFLNQCASVVVNTDRGKLSVLIEPEKTTYAPGDSVSMDISVADSSGKGFESEISVSVVDKALLDLTKSSYRDNLDVYTEFYTSVRQNSQQYGFPYTYNYYGGWGAGGGGEEVRSNFADAAYWNGNVQTDTSGRATVEFTLPDNLTTWMVRAVAVTKDTRVGQGTSDIIARKDVRLDVNAPNYLRTGDGWKMELDAVNYSESSIEAQVSVACEGCEESSYVANVQLTSGSRVAIPFTLDPQDAADSIQVMGTLTAKGTTYDRISLSIPVSRSGFDQNTTQALLLEKNDEIGAMSIFVPENADLPTTTLRLTFSRSFINEWALVPVDPTVRSSIDLSSSILHNSFFVGHYDEVLPSERKEVFIQKVDTALDLLGANQSDNGGYGWFDYDAVNFEASCYVGVALGRAVKAGVSVDEDRMENLQLYLKAGLNLDTVSIDEKIYAVYALAVMGDETVLPFVLDLKSDPSSFSGSPLNVAHLMLALEELGSDGDAGELAQYLQKTAVISARGALWEDADAPFRIIQSQEYVSAVAFSALAKFPAIDITEKARTWLIENPVGVYGNSPDAVAVFSSLANASLESLSSRHEVTTVSVRVNGKTIRTFDVDGGKNYSGAVTLSLDSSVLEKGLNAIEVSRSREGSLYIVANMTYAAEGVSVLDDFGVTRTLRDFETGEAVTVVAKGDVVLIRTTVEVDRDGYNLVVTDILPSGFEPVRYQLGSYDYLFYRKWWKWGQGGYVNWYGSVTSDRITFTEYKVDAGKTYTFEYPAVATYAGAFSGGGAESYFLGFGDVGGSVWSPKINIE